MLDPKLDAALELLQRKDGLLAAVCYATTIEVQTLPLPYGTTATTGDKILVDPRCLVENDVPVLAGLLAHEASHLVFEHAARKKHREHDRWNAACDKVINRCLLASAYQLPSWGHKDGTDRDEETLYESEPQSAKGQCLMLAPADGTAADAVQARVRATVEAAIQAGTAPSWVKSSFKPRDSRLRLEPLLTFITRGREEYTWRRPARATQACDIYLPSLGKQIAAGCVMVSVDTSGSMSSEDIERALGVVQRVCRSRAHRLIVVVQDTEAEVIYDGAAEGWRHRPIRSGGGTDFRPLMRLVAKMRPDVLVAITDLEGPHGPRPNRTKVLWVVPESASQPPFGSRCKLN